MSTSINDTDAIARAFGVELAEAWQKRHSEEDAIAETYAPVVDHVAALLGAIARAATEVTGQEAKVSEIKREFHVSTGNLITDHCVTHPSGNLHVRLRYGPAGVEYHREVVKHPDLTRLYGLIAKAALTHFAPKPS